MGHHTRGRLEQRAHTNSAVGFMEHGFLHRRALGHGRQTANGTRRGHNHSLQASSHSHRTRSPAQRWDASTSHIQSYYSYLGEYYSDIKESGIPAGNYSQLNLKAGFVFNQITVDLFVNNAANSDNVSWVGTIQSFTGRTVVNRLRPRTIGINAGYQF